MYRDVETRHRQALWEVIHALYLLIEQRDRDLELAQLYKQLKQRRSRFRTLWKKVLRFILQGGSTDIAIWTCSWTPSSCISRRRSRCVHGTRVWVIHRRTYPT